MEVFIVLKLKKVVNNLPEHPIEGLMKTTMSSLKEMVDVNTIIGDPVSSADGLVIIPISRVSFGFASGGSEYSTGKDIKNSYEDEEGKFPFGGGSGAGVSVQPVGFIVVGNEQIKLLPVDEGNSALNNLFDFMGKVIDNFQGMKDKDNNKDNDKDKESTNITQ